MQIIENRNIIITPNTIPFIYSFDDGKGDYGKSYDSYGYDIDYADYSTERSDNNFKNVKLIKKKKSKKELNEEAWKKI